MTGSWHKCNGHFGCRMLYQIDLRLYRIDLRCLLNWLWHIAKALVRKVICIEILDSLNCCQFDVNARPHQNYARGIWKHNFTKTKLLENTSQTWGILKCWLFVFIWLENILKTVLFENDDLPIIIWFTCQVFLSDANPKWPVVVGVFKFLYSVDRIHLMRFQSESTVAKFLQWSVDSA